MAWSLAGYTAPGTYNAATNKPSGLSGPGYIVVDCAHFYDSSSTATIAGFSSARAAIGGNGVIATKLWRYYADLSTAPSSFSVTLSGSGGDAILACSAYAGLDASSPVPSGGTQSATSTGATTLTVAGGAVTVADALAHISCASWDFSEWSASSPTGYTRDSGSSTSECGTFHTTAPQAVGTSLGATFSGTSGANEEACVLVVFQIPSASSQPANSQFFAAASG